MAKSVIEKYKDAYPELVRNQAFVLTELNREEAKFAKTLKQGTKEFEKLVRQLEGKTTQIDGAQAFHLYDTFGFPIELTVEMAAEKGYAVDEKGLKRSLQSTRKNRRPALPSALRAALRIRRRLRHSCIRQPICCWPLSAQAAGETISISAAVTLRRSVCALTLTLAAR